MAQTYSSIKEAGVSPTRNLLWNPSQDNNAKWSDNTYDALSGTLDKRCFYFLGWNSSSIGGAGGITRYSPNTDISPKFLQNVSGHQVQCTGFNTGNDRYLMYSTGTRFIDFRAEDPNFGTSLASPMTLSFWVNCPVTGTFIVELASQRLSNSQGSYYYKNSQTYTINTADTWEYKTVTFPAFTTPQGYTDYGTFPYIEPNYTLDRTYFALNFWLIAGSDYTSGTLNTGTWAEDTDNTTRAGGITSNFLTSVQAGNNPKWIMSAPQLECSPVATNFSIAPQKGFHSVFNAVSKSPVRGSLPITGDFNSSTSSYITIPWNTFNGSSQNLCFLQTGTESLDVDLNCLDKTQMGQARMYSASSGASSNSEVTADSINKEGYLRINASNFQPGQNRAQTLAFYSRDFMMCSMKFFEANNLN